MLKHNLMKQRSQITDPLFWCLPSEKQIISPKISTEVPNEIGYRKEETRGFYVYYICFYQSIVTQLVNFHRYEIIRFSYLSKWIWVSFFLLNPICQDKVGRLKMQQMGFLGNPLKALLLEFHTFSISLYRSLFESIALREWSEKGRSRHCQIVGKGDDS